MGSTRVYDGTVFLPARISKEQHPSDWSSLFAETLAKTFSWKIVCSNKLLPSDIEGEILFTIKAPQLGYPNVLTTIDKISKDIKIVNYLQDIRGDDQNYLRYMHQMLERSDLILYSYKESFENGWPEYIKKGVYFPVFIIPSERFLSLEQDINAQEKKCLVIGCTDRKWYPLRHKATMLSRDLFNVIPHPGYDISFNQLAERKNRKFVDAIEYAEMMNKHICCVTSTLNNECSNRTNHWVVLKLFEIMAAGSILISDWCEEMNGLGFIDGINFIDADANNLEEKVGDIVGNPAKYEKISKEGRAFVKNNHTIERRIESLKKILRNIGYRNS